MSAASRASSDRRVWITGIGLITSIGIGKEPFWDGLHAGKSGGQAH